MALHQAQLSRDGAALNKPDGSTFPDGQGGRT